MKPTIPGIQNSWQPSVYPLPQQGPPTPPGFNYQFSAPGTPPMLNTGYVPTNNKSGEDSRGFIHANAPVAPQAPGYIGPSMAQAYQMAGPRVGFQTAQAPVQSMPSAPPASVVNPFLGGGFSAGGGGGSLFDRVRRMFRAVP